jgi:hypothetical protein
MFYNMHYFSDVKIFSNLVFFIIFNLFSFVIGSTNSQFTLNFKYNLIYDTTLEKFINQPSLYPFSFL